MNIIDLSEQVRRVSDQYARTNSIVRDRAWYAFKVSEEAGEVAKAYLSLTGQSRTKVDPETAREELANELADLIAHGLLLAANEGLDVEAALKRKWLSYLSS